MRWNILYLLALLAFGNSAHAYAPPTQMLAVVEEEAGYLDFYNPTTGAQLGGIKLGYLPHEIEISKDGKTAYISNFGIKDYDRRFGAEGSSISVIDIPSRAEKYRLYTYDTKQQQNYADIVKATHGLKLRPPYEKELFANAEAGGKMLVFDVETKKLKRQFDINANSHNLVFSPDGKTLWIMAGPDGIIRVDPDTGRETGNIKLNSAVRGLKYTSDQRYLLASMVNEVVLIDPVTMTIYKRFADLGVGQILYSDMSPQQDYIAAPAAFDNQVVIIDVKTQQVVKRIITGLNPTVTYFSPDGKFVYATNATDKHISKINMQTFAVEKFKTKEAPNNIMLTNFIPVEAKTTITAAVPLPLSGAEASVGRDMMRGYEYWRSTVNEAGGLYFDGKAHLLKIVYADTQSNANAVYALTNELIKNNKVDILLATNGQEHYDAEAKAASEARIPITPAQTNTSAWMPNDATLGADYFATSNRYNDAFYAKYSFKASTYSASATALGIVLQQALLQVPDMNYEDLMNVLQTQEFALFFDYRCA